MENYKFLNELKRYFKINFNNNTNSLSIKFCTTDYFNNMFDNNNSYLECLWYLLGDEDIISCSEIGENYIVFNSNVYTFNFNELKKLQLTGEVELFSIGLLQNILDRTNKEHVEYYNWYSGLSLNNSNN